MLVVISSGDVVESGPGWLLRRLIFLEMFTKRAGPNLISFKTVIGSSPAINSDACIKYQVLTPGGRSYVVDNMAK
jgi:hypothetical protein